MIVAEKPGSPGEVLEHFGTKGMKWGVRKADTRAAVARRNASFQKKNPTSRQKADTIRLARATSNVKYEKATRLAATKAERKAAKLAYQKDPQRAIALRTTRGEKVVLGLLAATGVATIPIAAVVGGQYAYRKHVEKKQAAGGYK
jgi:hypothetical protein